MECRRQSSLAVRFLTALIRGYQKIISPLFPGCCRYRPTCSAYAMEALRVHGFFGGSWLTLRRLLRCHPLGGSGYDPVPPGKGAAFRTKRRTKLLTGLFVFVFSAGVGLCSVLDGEDALPRAVSSVGPTVKEEQAVSAAEEAVLNPSTRFFIRLIQLYQTKLSPFFPGQCRYTPTCSTYGIQALKKYGTVKGLWLTFKRVLRCNPWGGHGEDPLP